MIELTALTLPRLSLAHPRDFWYLGTPYAKYPLGRDAAAGFAAQIAGALMKQGVRIFCPMAHGHTIATWSEDMPVDHDFWLDQDGPFIHAAVGLIVVRMEGWRESRGLAEEIERFTVQGKAIYGLRPGVVGLPLLDANDPCAKVPSP